MSSVNKVILIGNLGRDPEVRYLEGDKAVANFSIATSESFTGRNGEKVEQTEWHEIEVWDGMAKTAEKYLKKGNKVYVEGKIKTNNWKDKDGNDKQTKKIRVTAMTLLGGPNPGGGSSQARTEQSPVESHEQGNVSDDLPF
jgi:single-strand DNA-binding protein